MHEKYIVMEQSRMSYRVSFNLEEMTYQIPTKKEEMTYQIPIKKEGYCRMTPKDDIIFFG